MFRCLLVDNSILFKKRQLYSKGNIRIIATTVHFADAVNSTVG